MTNQNRPIIYSFLGIISIVLSSCSDKGESILQDIGEEVFSLEFPTRADVGDDSSSGLDPLAYYFTDDKSILLIEQRTVEHSLNFNDIDEITGQKNKFLYKYKWEGKEANTTESGEAPNWNIGYNFIYDTEWNNPMVWSTVKENGPFNASFQFGALFYPIENQIRTTVETDQRSLENLGKSNILGTYHRTQALYERFRFRLFHLMACIRVNILVPDMRIDEKDGLTGYDERIISAKLLNLYKDFSINWGTASSDEPPTLQADETTGTKADILMYAHAVDSRELITVNLSNFGLKGEDNVRVYTFTGLFPAQTLSNIDNILQFDIMDRKGENPEANFYWSSSQLTTYMPVSQGTITNLVLYLPRIGNEAIIATSQIIDWDKTDSSLTLTPEEN